MFGCNKKLGNNNEESKGTDESNKINNLFQLAKMTSHICF